MDGRSIQGYTNQQAVEVLRSTGQNIKLCLERYLRGRQFEQLQQAIADSELKTRTPSSPSATSLPRFPVSTVSGLFLCLEICVSPLIEVHGLNLSDMQPVACWLINAWVLDF